jgi:lipopolysaccharide transport system ATP-binding protein
MICGTLNPTAGNVQTNGRVAALLELGSGFNPEFTGRENIYLNASVLGLSNREIDERFDAIAAFADIGDFIEQPIKTYSSGMAVRLAFAVMAHVDADILVIDEALSVGDAFFTQKCMRFLHRFMKTGTIIFVSHDTGAVANLCDRAILLNQGEISKIGTPKEVCEVYLASLYQADQISAEIDPARSKDFSVAEEAIEYRDARESLINSSILRNDIEVFKFNPDQSDFGTGSATITAVRFLDSKGFPLSWFIGGEEVVLEIRCLAHKELLRPIVGFQFKDRLGQVIFSDNTFFTYQFNPQRVKEAAEIIARFEFRLPILPTGDYSVSPAIAEGTQEEHVQHHWVHDALIIRVHSSSVHFGLIGLPMKKIILETF